MTTIAHHTLFIRCMLGCDKWSSHRKAGIGLGLIMTHSEEPVLLGYFFTMSVRMEVYVTGRHECIVLKSSEI